MASDSSDPIYARLGAAAPRRWFGFLVVFGLGILLIYLSFVSLGGVVSRAFLIAFGILCIFAADKLRIATQGQVLLTENGIEAGDGSLLVAWDNIKHVERGAFALKPSNGFTVHTKEKMPRAWAPGLWWRLGRRFGVGGVSSAGPAKFMAEQIAFRLAQQD